MSTPPQEIDLMGGVDIVDWGPTEPDELAILEKTFSYGDQPGTFTFRVGSLRANTVAAVLNESQKWIGVSGRPNRFSREYADRHGSAFLTAAWCDMFQTYVSRHAPAPAMLPHGDRAFTPWHAHDFEQVDQAHAGTRANVIKYAVPGALIFFDWGMSDSSPKVDHVGKVIRNLGDGRIVTIEGNTSDKVALRVRSYDVIAVIGVPAYLGEAPPPVKPVGSAWPYQPGTLMKRGWLDSAGVRKVQARLNALGYRPKLTEDGDFGAKTEAGVRWAQARFKISVDGVVGPITWGKLFS